MLAFRESFVFKVVVRKAERRENVDTATDIYDSSSAIIYQLAHNAVGEKECAQIVSCKMHFKAIGANRALWNIHDASIIHKNINTLWIGIDLSRCGADGLEGGIIEFVNTCFYMRVC